jgi:uncharacterized RDD family membrane protein YckC
MFCASCGGAIQDGAPFCPRCGARQPAQEPGYTPVPQFGGSAAAPQMAGVPAAFAAGYAPWGTRALGFIIDGLLVGAGMAVLYFVLAGVISGMAGLGGFHAAGGMCCMFLLLFPLATLLVGLYNGVYLIAQRGSSIGQGLMNIKVVDANGNLLTQGAAFIRLLVRAVLGFVPLLPLLDLLWPLWDARGQTLHDKAVNCYVVNNPRSY